ncbi:MAG: hypothetical protein HC906_16875 [Bacteroidales bacterium]|nr:hypothetical protein [Bacteroidales bacterium]
MIPFIMFSSFIYGLALFNEGKLKFEYRYRPVLVGALFSSGLNIGLNFLLIPFFDYQIAALTTFISYLVLFLIFYSYDDIRYLHYFKQFKMLKISALFLIQLGIDLIIRHYYDLNEYLTLLEGLLFLIIYFYSFTKPKEKYKRSAFYFFKYLIGQGNRFLYNG